MEAGLAGLPHSRIGGNWFHRFEGQAEVKRAPATLPAHDADLTSHQLHQVAADGKSQPCSALAAILIGQLHELGEDSILILEPDARSGIANLVSKLVAGAGRPQHLHLHIHTPGGGEFQGIAQQIHQHLLDTQGISQRPRGRRRVDFHSQGDTLSFEQIRGTWPLRRPPSPGSGRALFPRAPLRLRYGRSPESR